MIYFVQSESGPIKIGYTASVTKRLSQIKGSTVETVTLLGTMDGDRSQEKELHTRFIKYNIKGEWFSPADDILEFIQANTKAEVRNDRPELHHGPKVINLLKAVGANIKMARLRRNITAAMLAERIGVTRVTLRGVEAGAPGVCFGTYALALFSLGLQDSLIKLAEDDTLGRKLQDAKLPTRARAKY